MSVLQLKEIDRDEFTCEITECLDAYLNIQYPWFKTYISAYDDETLVIRVPGATRGCIKFKDNIINEINIYPSTGFKVGIGCFYLKDKEEIEEKLKEFIGAKFEFIA